MSNQVFTTELIPLLFLVALASAALARHATRQSNESKPSGSYDEIKNKYEQTSQELKKLAPIGDGRFSDKMVSHSAVLKQLAAEIADLKKSNPDDKKTEVIQQLEQKIKNTLSEVENFVGSNSPLRDNRKLHYQEAGQWARHFSTVRMTVMTFTVTTCAAIIAWKWQTEFAKSADKHLDTYQVITKTVGVLFGLGAIIFWIFTYLTYKQVYRQRENRRYLPTEIGQEPKQPRVPFDVASLAVPVLTFGFRWMFDLCFHLSPKWAVTLCGFFTLGVLVPFAIYFYFNYLKSRKSQSYWFAGILIVLLVVAAFFCFSVIFGWNSDYLGWLGGLAVKPPQACLPFNRVPSTELKLSPPVMRCCLSRTAF